MSEETVVQSKTLGQDLSLWNACFESRSGLTLVEIAESIPLTPSKVHRLLSTLEAQTAIRATQLLGGLPPTPWAKYD
ncbi:MAG TPA: hypothetical protein DEF72_07745 [Gammaproteobacteria bacterium]|nr:hypothetical protein [Gammaproteobacteria bacterium]HBX27309.1 hypothetical protein [Gammaproteobacteria bacterium]